VTTKQEAPYFGWETVQLTEAILANFTQLGLGDAGLMGFGSGSKPGPTAACKAFPGDASYPSPATWKLLNQTTGGALIKTIPLAAPCYANWTEAYNPGKCADITARWGTPQLQYVTLSTR
jgi:hypothetical protein